TKAFMESNDEYQHLQWHFHDPVGGIDLQKAWDIALKGSFRHTLTPVNVAVIDSGILPHVDLSSQVVEGIDFVSNPIIGRDGNGRDLDPTDPGDYLTPSFCGQGVPATDTPSSWHGTVVSGIIAASINNGEGVSGIAPNARIVPIRVMGPCGGSMLDALEGLLWAAGEPLAGIPNNPNPVGVANLSLGVSGLACTAEIQSLIDTAVNRGVTVVVATGNEGANADQVVPTSCDHVIAVAAASASGKVTDYSNLGSVVDLLAPGGSPQNPIDSDEGILSTSNNGQQAAGQEDYIIGYAGTSVAAPHVTGVIALMLGLNPTLTPAQVEKHLIASAIKPPERCDKCGAGRLSASGAVKRVAGSSDLGLLIILSLVIILRSTLGSRSPSPRISSY
ncbi:MAG: S8 family serine peptidase, partial [Gammaproteobacteria bacterium]